MNTVISNRIYVTDPSNELIAWVKENMKFPNPEYAKKERMGFWLGRTPKELRLYEWNGNTLILPFGVCREIMPMVRGSLLTCDFKQDSVIDYGGTGMGLYPYQEKAVNAMMEAKYGILKATTGSGKTQMGIALIKRFRRRALWLCHTTDLLKQSMDRARMYMDPLLFGTITEGQVDVGIGVTFATVQTMANLELTQYKDYWDVVIVDECFPQYTLIDTINGRKAIKKISLGEYVLTLDHLGKPCYRKVLTVFKKKPQTMVRVALHGTGSIYCTANHQILTQRGYISAGELTSDDAVLCMRDPSRSYESDISAEIQFASREETGILLGLVQNESGECLDGETQRTQQKNDAGIQCKIRVRQDAEKQSVKASRNTEEDIKTHERDWTYAFRSWWKRHWGNHSTKNTDECIGIIKPNIGICDTDENSTREWISNELQSRYCNHRFNAGDRDRWKFTLPDSETEAGCEKRICFEFIRVDCVEVQQQTSDGTYGGLCPDGCVYNLEIEENHNYFANGVNVHNCHRVSSSATTFTRYEKVLNHLAARHKIGLTATPQRSDGLIRATFALIGNVAYEVPEVDVADRVMGVSVRPIETGTEISEECLNPDGTINYVQMIGYLTEDRERNDLIAEKIIENRGHSCLILSERLDQLEAIMFRLPEFMLNEAAYVNGRMTSKKAKAEREQAIDDMRTGKKKYLFASYSLAKEGLDVPRLDRLFLASPAKYSAIITQAVGRVRRTFEGKETPIVYDFVDRKIGFCERAYKERCRSYRKMGAEIERGT